MMYNFIKQTALDYDLPYADVKYIYEKYRGSGKFYEKLEELLKENMIK